MQLKSNELMVDGEAVCLMSHTDSYVLEPKCTEVQNLSIISLYESWYEATEFHPDTHVVIAIDEERRLPWESDLEDVYFTKGNDLLVITLHFMTAYPESHEAVSDLINSVDLNHAVRMESVELVTGKSYGNAEISREWDVRLICISRSFTFGDLFQIRKDISKATFNARDDVDDSKNLIFRVYVPSNRLYASETDKLITLFHDWLSSTGRSGVRLARYKTPAGQAYEFSGGESLSREHLSQEFNSFSAFLKLCVQDSSAAITTLSRFGVQASLAERIVERYGRETRRLELELSHERESRILSIRHSLESELLDSAINAEQWIDITALVDSLVPGVANLSMVSLPALPNAVPVSVSVNQQFIHAVESTVIQSVHGETNVGSQTRELLNLVRQFGEDRAAELESAIHELEDPDIPQNIHVQAKERIKGFLRQLGGKVEDVALTAFMKYLDTKFPT